MTAFQPCQAKYSGTLLVGADTDRKEVVVRDSNGTHRFTVAQVNVLRAALMEAAFTVILADLDSIEAAANQGGPT